MTPRGLLRIAVLRTNPYWPFTALNRKPYALAIKVFVRTCRKFSAIKSVYLRHSLDNQEWTPALSDIDLTVIIDGSLTREAEFSFLRSFWRRIGPVTKLFPMLGEIEILTEQHLMSWARFGIEGRGVSRWLLLHGTETPIRKNSPGPARFSLEAFDYAFSFYLWHFTRIFIQRDAPRYLITQDLLRLLCKIEKCVAELDAGEPASSVPEQLDRDAAILLQVLETLELGLRKVGVTGDTDPAAERRRSWVLR